MCTSMSIKILAAIMNTVMIFATIQNVPLQSSYLPIKFMVSANNYWILHIQVHLYKFKPTKFQASGE